MDETTEALDRDTVGADAFPSDVAPGTVLIAGTVEPSTYALGLRALHRLGGPDDAAMIVTTTESADRTLAAYDAVRTDSGPQSIGIVDAASERQYLNALYDETPVVFVPSPGDLERLVLAISDLDGNRLPSSGTRHLVVRSLTPMLENAPMSRVRSVIERVIGLRTGSGLTILGVDYTAHDEATMAALTELVDGVLWVTRTAEGHLEFEFQPTSGRHRPTSPR
ncbi:hypothetical protein G9464_17665 [Halostella sp. JP-L12]|uniref:DUF7504 family protein n=1 Tax=Halostella TaxID=1843185 RepID=UPI000EF841E9|nr:MULTISPECIES: hypothetical protein [Halostella]NHN49401.1 hypothetical protein [Halostella sp. JP-L12]